MFYTCTVTIAHMTFSSAPASGQSVRFHPHDCVRTVLYEPPVKSDAFISKSRFMPPISAVMPSCDCCSSTTVISVCVCVFFVISVCDPVLGDHGSMVSLASVWLCSTIDVGPRLWRLHCVWEGFTVDACVFLYCVHICVCVFRCASALGVCFKAHFPVTNGLLWSDRNYIYTVIHSVRVCARACRVFITLFKCSFSRIMILFCRKNKDEREDQY